MFNKIYCPISGYKGERMRFLSWLFGASRRHYAGIRRYEKGGAGIRVVTVVVSLLFIAVALGLEYWLFSSLSNENSLGGGGQRLFALFGIGILFVATAAATLEYCAVYCVTAFRMAAWGVALSLAKRKEIAEKKHIENAEAEWNATPLEQGRFKGADIFIGILQIVFIAGLLAGVVGVAALLL